MRPAAIGYLRTDISGIYQQRDEEQIRRLARNRGYRLRKTVAFSRHTHAPIARLLNVVRSGDDIEAVITPSAQHFGGTIPDDLATTVSVLIVTPHTESASNSRV